MLLSREVKCVPIKGETALRAHVHAAVLRGPIPRLSFDLKLGCKSTGWGRTVTLKDAGHSEQSLYGPAGTCYHSDSPWDVLGPNSSKDDSSPAFWAPGLQPAHPVSHHAQVLPAPPVCPHGLSLAAGTLVSNLPRL